MDWNKLFSVMNSAALLGWLVLIAAPRGWRPLALLPRYAIPAAISVLYVALIGAYFASAGGGFGSIAEVRRLFDSDPVLVAGWGHYLAFDLLIGTMLAERLGRAGVGRLLQAPVLGMTFMFGPAGWLLGLITEGAARFAGRRAVEA